MIDEKLALEEFEKLNRDLRLFGVRAKRLPRNPRYVVTADGRVFSLYSKFGREVRGYAELKQYVNKERGYLKNNQYPIVSLHGSNGKRKTSKVYQLVQECFGEWPRPEGMECRHLDGDPLNSHIDNLTWGTGKDNWADRRRHGRDVNGENNGRAKLSAEQVKEIRALLAEGELSQAEIGRIYKTPSVTINHIKTGYTWS